VQFHPESILTLEGKALLANWVRRTSGVDHAAQGADVPSARVPSQRGAA
jgi:hypothetical protein